MNKIDISKGRYWDLPWGLVSSCTRCSEGCRSCWALAMEKRFNKGIEGKIEIHPERLKVPLKRKKPAVYAIWNDLGHPDVTLGFRIKVHHVIRDCKQHIFLILTKRPVEILCFIEEYTQYGKATPDNIWYGLTVCNQQEADEKIPIFLQVSGKKFLSLEPLLGQVDIKRALGCLTVKCELPGDCRFPLCDCRKPAYIGNRIDAVILGGETGPGARPMHPEWVRAVRDQCEQAGVPFFFKSWGEWTSDDGWYLKPSGIGKKSDIVDSAPGDYSCSKSVGKIGKKAAGRILDGRTHDDLPWMKEAV